MQLENTIQNTFNNQAPHPNYKRIIVLISVIFVIIIAGAFTYQYFANKKAEKARDLVLREQYRTELIEQSKAFFESLPPRSQEVADKQRAESQEFFKNMKPVDAAVADADSKAFFRIDQEQAYQEWKASHQ